MSFFFLALNHTNGWHSADIALRQEKDHYILADETGLLHVRLQRRKAYPGTYAMQTASDITFGYGKPEAVDGEEFLAGKLAKTGKLTLHRDAFGTLPIFYADTPRGLLISNDYAELVRKLPSPKISRNAFAQAISDAEPMPTTFVEGVAVLWPDETLIYDQGTLRVELTRRRSWTLSSDAPSSKPRDFRRLFDDYLDYFIDSRLENQQIAFEVSGGLDSATLPQYFYRKTKTPVTMVGLIHADEQGQYQQHKLQMLSRSLRTNSTYETLDAKHAFPLARMVLPNRIWPTYFEKTYLEPTETYVAKLAAQGVDVLCKGSGGDELFGNVTENDPLSARTSRSARYATLCNNVYIEHGIWPVSPFVDPELYTWVQGLPVQHRSNKNILRAYHQANHFVEDIYNPRHNEEFTPFFTECFVSGVYDDFMTRLAEDSYGGRAGLIDLPMLLENYQRTQTEKYPDLDRDCFRIYLWMLAEINAQSLSGATSDDKLSD